MNFKDYPQLRFIKVRKQSKKPMEDDWTNKPYTWQEIQEHIKTYVNYGVLTGYGDLAVLDSDLPGLQEAVVEKLPPTFRVKTGRGTHNYFFVPGLNDRIVLETGKKDKNVIHWGEVQSKGQQVLGPGSIHLTGKIYEVCEDLPIATIEYSQLMKAIAPFKEEVLETYKEAKEESANYEQDQIDSLSVKSIWGTSGLHSKDGEWYGPHPIHGSEGGSNFWINESKNVWHCFRCDSGGGPLSAIAVKEGIVDCSEARRGRIRGETAFKCIEKARESYGLAKPQQVATTPQPLNKGDLVLWTFQDYENLQKDTNFLVQDVIYPKTVTMLFSPPGEFKSLVCLLMAMSVASGEDWLGFETKKCPVLYCDKENNDQIIKERLEFLFRGQNLENKEMPLYILRRNGDLLSKEFVDKLKKVIKEKEIKLLFFDTLHRFADYDENKSDDINRIYSFVFQPIIEEFGCSIVFLHHTKKDGGYRGSGDFLGMVDTAYAVYRNKPTGDTKSNMFRIVNEKCRAGEIETISAEIDFGTDYIKILKKHQDEEDERKINKIKELSLKLRSIIKPGEQIKKKEFEDRLQMEEYEFSVSTLKRCLNWLVNNHYFDKTDKGEYSLLST